MSSALKNLSTYDEANMPDAADFKFGIVVSEWNHKITYALYEACVETLLKHGAAEDQIFPVQVPGTFELPVGARMLAQKESLDAIICLGCVIKGETSHNEYINQSVASALQSLGLASSIPCIFGVLTPNDEQQALDRAGGQHGNKGTEAAATAIRMAALRKDLKSSKNTIGFTNKGI